MKLHYDEGNALLRVYSEEKVYIYNDFPYIAWLDLKALLKLGQELEGVIWQRLRQYPLVQNKESLEKEWEQLDLFKEVEGKEVKEDGR